MDDDHLGGGRVVDVRAKALAVDAPEVRRPGDSAVNPLVGLSLASRDSGPVVGRVTERLRAGSYTYFAMERDDGRREWAVVLGQGPLEGARVAVRVLGRRTGFYSNRLKRTFPELLFGVISRKA